MPRGLDQSETFSHEPCPFWLGPVPSLVPRLQYREHFRTRRCRTKSRRRALSRRSFARDRFWFATTMARTSARGAGQLVKLPPAHPLNPLARLHRRGIRPRCALRLRPRPPVGRGDASSARAASGDTARRVQFSGTISSCSFHPLDFELFAPSLTARSSHHPRRGCCRWYNWRRGSPGRSPRLGFPPDGPSV